MYRRLLGLIPLAFLSLFMITSCKKKRKISPQDTKYVKDMQNNRLSSVTGWVPFSFNHRTYHKTEQNEWLAPFQGAFGSKEGQQCQVFLQSKGSIFSLAKKCEQGKQVVWSFWEGNILKGSSGSFTLASSGSTCETSHMSFAVGLDNSSLILKEPGGASYDLSEADIELDRVWQKSAGQRGCVVQGQGDELKFVKGDDFNIYKRLIKN